MVNITHELATPEMAQALLATNPHNRKLSRSLVVQYTQLMQRGEWRFNGDAIRLDSNGALLDGQHRLSAIVESGISQRCIIIRGLDADSFKTIDAGKKRSTGDMLSIAGYKGAVAGLAAGARTMLLYDREVFWAKAAQRVDWSPSSAQVVDYANSHPDVAAAFYRLHESYPYCLKLLGSGPATMALTLMSRANLERALAFMDGFETGVTDGEGDPRLLLRETLVRHRLGSRRTMPWEEVAAFCLKSMNAYFQSKSIRLLRWKRNEPMPRFEPGDAHLNSTATPAEAQAESTYAQHSATGVAASQVDQGIGASP